MFGPFKPAPHIAELPAEKLIPRINAYVGKCLLASFGYAAYYFVRANFDLAQKA